MNKKICIAGTGGFARETFTLIQDLKRENDFEGFLEPDEIWEDKWKGKTIMNHRVLPFSKLDPSKHIITIGIANPKIRKRTTTQLPSTIEYISLIHPSAIISEWVEIGKGAIITAGCIITCQIKIGDFAQLNLDTTIGHDCNIGDFFTTAPSVNISGICDIGDSVYFGTGSAIRQDLSVCDHVNIGMGAMVVKNISESGTYVGIPATKL